ncbi:hypothetical protein STEG23_022951, partial [Scotinomys teguina]
VNIHQVQFIIFDFMDYDFCFKGSKREKAKAVFPLPPADFSFGKEFALFTR